MLALRPLFVWLSYIRAVPRAKQQPPTMEDEEGRRIIPPPPPPPPPPPSAQYSMWCCAELS
ncbi:hypothetical protein E2C01_091385 [Portunus trituberculatus]|uniref:Uncharacterized protein n=1 Tax=Portunus trituberculatus TaxID=210409 RepID=A0A5B7JNX1_PORTR|nr:hypothetical protein [Portunus trituberculatus]